MKTRKKTVLCLTGPFIAHETVYKCPSCFQIFVSDALLLLVPSRCNVAYDVLVFVGQALFQRYRTIEEVRIELLVTHNLRISASEVGYLGRKFIMYLAIGHRLATPRIRENMKRQGGYILHLDATHDGEAPALMTSIDSISKIVLENVKLPSEHTDYVVPFLSKIQSVYGNPIACVHDMGLGICKAVAVVFPGVPDFICHFHFLRDIGKDFMEPAYKVLRNALRKHSASTQLHALVRDMRSNLSDDAALIPPLSNAINSVNFLENSDLLPAAAAYSLALWALQGKKSGDGYGFPFDRTLLEFTDRLLELSRRLPELLAQSSVDKRLNYKPLAKLAKIVSVISNDSEICQAVEELHWRGMQFDRLREVMRIAPVDGSDGLNDDGTPQIIATIREGVELFRKGLDSDPILVPDKLCRKMATQIDKYSKQLFADPIEVKTADGTVLIYPQRTNNILEQFFRGMRSGHRRKTGNNSMSRVLQTMLADTPLVKNLDNQEYIKILLNGKATLEELFAEIAAYVPTCKEDNNELETGIILPGFRKLINLKNLPVHVANLFA